MLYYNHSFFLIEYLYQPFIAMSMMKFVERHIQVIALHHWIIACFECRKPFFFAVSNTKGETSTQEKGVWEVS